MAETGLRAVLGIDAAWTVTQPSGVALALNDGRGWRLSVVAASYKRFHACAHIDAVPEVRPTGSAPMAADLIVSATLLCGFRPQLVAIDMPMSRNLITCRRSSDDAVSRAYGSRHCSTHTPSVTRPGRISDDLTRGFAVAGYPLVTKEPPMTPGLIEVYPHPALVEFMRAPMRLKYKVGKGRTYWPGRTLSDRRCLVLAEWERIVAALEVRLPGTAAALPGPALKASGVELKAYEDMLDAVVCACVAICVLEGDAVPYGDEASAIWVPQPLDAFIS